MYKSVPLCFFSFLWCAQSSFDGKRTAEELCGGLYFTFPQEKYIGQLKYVRLRKIHCFFFTKQKDHKSVWFLRVDPIFTSLSFLTRASFWYELSDAGPFVKSRLTTQVQSVVVVSSSITTLPSFPTIFFISIATHAKPHFISHPESTLISGMWVWKMPLNVALIKVSISKPCAIPYSSAARTLPVAFDGRTAPLLIVWDELHREN